MDELTDEQKAVLDFERKWWKYQGAKEAAMMYGCGMLGGTSGLRVRGAGSRGRTAQR